MNKATPLLKTIYLARHAKSSWSSGASSDFDRPLSERGEKNAKRMAKELVKQGWKPALIIASPALRAKQTCNAYCESLELAPNTIQWNADFYAAYTVTLLQALANLPENTKSVMLVGHNPSMEDLLLHLCQASSLTKLQQSNGKLFTTGNVVKINFQSLWKDLVMADMTLDKILRPKAL